MLRELISTAMSKFGGGGQKEAQARALLLQALDMRALVVVLEYALHEDVDRDTMSQLLESFVVKELGHSGQRFVLVGSTDLALPLEDDVTFSMESFGLNMRGWVHFDMVDGVEKKLEAARLIHELHSSRVGRMVSTLNLSSNPLDPDASRAAYEWLRTSSCVLTSLDVSFTGLQEEDWENLCMAFQSNASLTYLDIRAWPPPSDNVLHHIGSSLLDPASPLALKYARTNAFDIVEGASKLNLEETAVGPGAISMIAGLLKHNASLRELNLNAAGVTSDGAAALATALRSNWSLSVLRLLHNPLESTGRAHIDDAVAERTAAGHPLQLLELRGP